MEHYFKNEQLNSIIERGRKLGAIKEQLETIAKTAKSDEVRAVAAAVSAICTEVSQLVVFKS